LETEMLANTDNFLNVAVTRLATAQRRTFYRKQLMDRVFFLLPERSPMVVQRATLSGDLSVVADISLFPQEIAETLDQLANPSFGPLSPACRWYLESLREIDSFTGFLWAFFAMETLVNWLGKLSHAVQRLEAEPTLQHRTRAIMIAAGISSNEIDFTKKTPFLKLAVVAPQLSSAFAEDWLKEFKAVTSFRGKLAHANEAEVNQLTQYRNRATNWLEGVLAAAIEKIRSSASN